MYNVIAELFFGLEKKMPHFELGLNQRKEKQIATKIFVCTVKKLINRTSVSGTEATRFTIIKYN